MHRRGLLRAVGAGVAATFTGCSELGVADGDGDAAGRSTGGAGGVEEGPTDDDGLVLGDADDPWSGQIVDVRGATADPLRSYFDASVPAILVGDDVSSAYARGQPERSVLDAIASAGGSVVSVSSVTLNGLPVCDVGSRLLLPGRLGEDAVRDAFPEAFLVARTTAVGGEDYWRVTSPLDATADVNQRIDALDVDDVDAFVYHSCDTAGR